MKIRARLMTSLPSLMEWMEKFQNKIGGAADTVVYTVRQLNHIGARLFASCTVGVLISLLDKVSSIIFPDYKGAQTHKKKKKKNSKKKERQNNDSSPCAASSSTNSGILREGVEGPYEISTQDSNAFEATIHGVQSSSMANMVADKLKLSNTPDKNVTVEDDINRGDCDLTPSPGFDRALEDFARRLISKGPVIYFDSSSHEELGSH
nr:PREDICTED: uncharacterized protein LOC108197154 isoform X3 [Daucus carota subsp. sativus]